MLVLAAAEEVEEALLGETLLEALCEVLEEWVVDEECDEEAAAARPLRALTRKVVVFMMTADEELSINV